MYKVVSNNMYNIVFPVLIGCQNFGRSMVRESIGKCPLPPYEHMNLGQITNNNFLPKSDVGYVL